MIKTTSDFITIAKEILHAIVNEAPVSELEEIKNRVGSQDFGEVMKFCKEQNFVIGVQVERVVNGRILVSFAEDYRSVTFYGLKFLEQN